MNSSANEHNEYYVKEQVPANLFRGIEAVGGRLNITNRRLMFNAHNFNVQDQSLVIMIADIVNIEKRNTLWLIPNGMKITIRDGQEFKFVVNKRSELIEIINSFRVR